jgi:hypothetical protein
MINKVVVAIVAALVVVAVPTLPAAEVWDKPYDRQSYIAFVAMLLTYNHHCASLRDHTKIRVTGWPLRWTDRTNQSSRWRS